MTIKAGCFALIDPFSLLDHQLERVAGLGFKYADVTDNHPGGILGREFGFTATASLDDNPQNVLDLFTKHGLTATSVCAHSSTSTGRTCRPTGSPDGAPCTGAALDPSRSARA